MDLVALAAELKAGHPSGTPYSPDNERAAAQLNRQDRAGLRSKTVSGAAVLSAITLQEFQAMSAVQREYLRLIAQSGSVPLTAPVVAALNAMVPGLVDRCCLETKSRADELGLGAVTPSDVADARRLP